MTWPDWIEKHSTLFGMADEKNLAMLLEWSGLFASCGHSPDELADATARLAAMADQPRFRADQLPVLNRLVRDAQAGRFERAAQEPPRAECKLCGGDGMLGVPDYAGMAKYERLWHRAAPWLTQTVYCRCPLGLWKARQPKRSLQSLAEYEEANEGCDWRRDLEQRRLELRAWEKARGHAGALDRELGKLMRRARDAGGRVQAAADRVGDARGRGDDAGDG